jgi:hypothetical protein
MKRKFFKIIQKTLYVYKSVNPTNTKSTDNVEVLSSTTVVAAPSGKSYLK